MEKFDIEILGLGNNITGYPGAFTPVVNKIILNIIRPGGELPPPIIDWKGLLSSTRGLTAPPLPERYFPQFLR